MGSPPRSDERQDRFATALAALDRTLDWVALGRSYCDEGGEEFFGQDARDAVMDAGLHFAADLRQQIDQLPRPGAERSLWFGAAVAELAPLLFDAVVLGRACSWQNLDGTESRELNRALTVVSREVGLELPRVDTSGEPPQGPFDLLWVVSVFTDPEAFPALHDDLYERVGTHRATGRGNLSTERAAAQSLAAGLLRALQTPGLLVTSDEEVPLFADACTQLQLQLEVSKVGRLSGVVGDVVRFCQVRRA